MRALYAISYAAIAGFGCGSTSETVTGGGGEPGAVMTDVRVGGCAPIRYRERDLEAEKPEPPKPRVAVRFDVPSYAGAAFKTAMTRELEALEPRLLTCFKPSDIDENAQVRVTVTFYLNRGGQVMRVRARGSRKASCVQGIVRSRIRRVNVPGNRTSAYVRLKFSASTRGKPPDEARIVLVEGRDRVKTSLTLAAAVAARGPGLERCVRRAGLSEPGQLAASLQIEEGAVSATELNAGDELGECAEKVLSEIDLDDAKINGAFQCAASYGIEGAAAPAFATTVTARSVAVAGAEPISEALIREQRPPAGPLYQQLSERRFARDGGPSTALRLTGDAPGALVVRAAEAATAADVDIGAVEVRRGDRWTSIADLSRMDTPALSTTTAQSAGPVVLVTAARLWAGAGLDTHARELETSALDRLADHLAALRASPGLAHRTDVVVGVGPEVRGDLLAAVIERVRRAGFDQLELVAAETARARLAR